jgi:hypothetical protein
MSTGVGSTLIGVLSVTHVAIGTVIVAVVIATVVSPIAVIATAVVPVSMPRAAPVATAPISCIGVKRPAKAERRKTVVGPAIAIAIIRPTPIAIGDQADAEVDVRCGVVNRRLFPVVRNVVG